MTIGYWQQQAHTALRAAAAAMRNHRAASTADAFAVIGARSSVYRHLARVIELLVGGVPTDHRRYHHPGDILHVRQYAINLSRLYDGLRAAARVGQCHPVPTAEPSPAARCLSRAAEAISVIGDILASHTIPLRRPRTPQGMDLIAGMGIEAALGSIAGLAADAFFVDSQLCAWLDCDDYPLTVLCQPVVEAIEHVGTSRLTHAAQALIVADSGQSDLVGMLDVASPPIADRQAIRTPEEASTALTAVVHWLWQNPDQMAVAHLQRATQLGHAVQVAAGTEHERRKATWHHAVMITAALHGAPASSTAAAAAAGLDAVLRWARCVDPAGTPNLSLHGQLPSLAATLHRGLRRAVQRRDVFAGDTVLRRPPRSLIYKAVPRWRPVSDEDERILDLGRLLLCLHQHDADPQQRPCVVARRRRVA